MSVGHNSCTYAFEGRVASTSVYAGSSVVAKVAGDSYTYDANGNLTADDVAGPAAVSNSYAYNPAGNLVSFTEDSQSVAYGWDHDGNRLSATQAGATTRWAYRADDSLAQASPASGGGVVDYHYSDAGRLTRTDTHQGGKVCASYTYDGFGRTATQVEHENTTCGTRERVRTSYGYDGLDRVHTTHTHTSGGAGGGSGGGSGATVTTTTSSYDGLGTTLTGQAGALNASGSDPAPVVVYQLDPGGVPVAYRQARASASTTWLDADGQGNITTLLPQGASTASCVVDYDPFGTPLHLSGAAAGAPNGVCASGPAADSTGNVAWYRAAARDAVHGTYQFGTRTYDPATAAFTTPDTRRLDTPAQDLAIGTDPLTANNYTYVNGDPVNLTDPNGHRAVDTSGNEVPWCVTHHCTPEATTQAHTDYHHASAQTHADVQVEQAHKLFPWTDRFQTAWNAWTAQQAQAQERPSAWMRFVGGFLGEAKDTVLFLLDSFRKLETNYYLTPAGIHESFARDLAIAHAIAHPKDTLHSIVAACTADIANCAAGRGTFIALTSVIGGAGIETRLARGTEELSTLPRGAAANGGGDAARFVTGTDRVTTDLLAPSGKLPFPKHLVPEGMTPNAYGNSIWGVGPQGAKDLIGARSASELESLGLTVRGAEQWQDFYLNVYTLNPRNAAAGARVDLMQNIIDTLRGPR